MDKATLLNSEDWIALIDFGIAKGLPKMSGEHSLKIESIKLRLATRPQAGHIFVYPDQIAGTNQPSAKDIVSSGCYIDAKQKTIESLEEYIVVDWQRHGRWMMTGLLDRDFPPSQIQYVLANGPHGKMLTPMQSAFPFYKIQFGKRGETRIDPKSPTTKRKVVRFNPPEMN